MTVGVELARARRQLRISRTQLSKRTNLSLEWLAAIEEGDLDRLPDMIHLRTCVSTFAQEVGLDPDSVSARYMAQLTGRSSLEEFESEESASFDDSGRKVVDWKIEHPAQWRPVAAVPLLSWGRTGYAALVTVTLITLSIGFWTSAVRESSDATLSWQHPDAQMQSAPDFARRENGADEARVSLDGAWLLTSEVQKSSLRSYDDLTLGFRLQLEQNGNRVRGHGLKWTENGRLLTLRARTPISVDGTLNQGRLVLAFTERGTRRTSHGTLHMQVAGNGTLQGRFSTDAARSIGRVHAVRMSSRPE